MGTPGLWFADTCQRKHPGHRFKLFGEGTHVLMLRSPSLHPRNLLRYEVTAKLLSGAGIAYESVEAIGKSALAQVLSLIYLGDYPSFYLSILNEVDSTSTDAMNFVKQYLAQSSSSTD